PRFAMASVSFTPRGWASRKVTAASGWRLLPRLAIPGLALLLLGWFVGRITITRTPAPRPIAAPQPAPVPTPIQQSTASVRAGREQPLVFNLISDDLVTRGAGGSDVVVAVPSQPAVITLNLPINPESRHRSFRAALSEFPRERELLRENGLRAKSSPAGTVVTFLVPSQFLKTNQNYTVKVTVATSGGSQELNSYSFRTIKKLE
ncbi:MAG TPA: hypothetical protein VLT16_01100, partial [Candidatus Limnocylindrales bacterium]|nr:hypothetical protein [Candidatus Limnocylindrales bacterium]